MLCEGFDILNRPDGMLLAGIGAVALIVNLPLGYLREGKPRFSIGWFVYIHLSVPLIAYLRIRHHISPWAIPPFIVCAVAGQIAGGWMRRYLQRRA
jgi:hypothetical protein